MNRMEDNNLIRESLRLAMPDDLPPEVGLRMQRQLMAFRKRLSTEAPVSLFSSMRGLLERRLAGWRAAGVAAAVLLVAVLFVSQVWHSADSYAWAEVVKAVTKKPWLHFVTTRNDGTRTEAWFSTRQGVLAARVVAAGSKCVVGGDHEGRAVIDIAQNTRDWYDPKEDLVIRTTNDPFRDGADPLEAIFSAFLCGDLGKTIDAGQFQLVPEQQRSITEGQKQWHEYRFAQRGENENPQYKHEWIIFVDTNTQLPFRWEQVTLLAADSSKVDQGSRHEIDYPAFGPEDIYALGVPKTAKLVDRTLRPDAERLAREIVSPRYWADDKFSALVVQSHENQPWWQGHAVYRVWKDGLCWKIDHSMGHVSQPRDKPPPADADQRAWWREKTKTVHFRHESLCDGESYWDYDAKTRRPTPADIAAGWPADTMVIVSTEKHRGLPVAKDHFHLGYPLGWGRPTDPYNDLMSLPGMEASVVAKPKSGPPNTTLLEVRNPNWKSPGSSEFSELKKNPQLWRFWIDPARDYLVMRREELIIADGRETITGGFAIEEVLQDLRGRWYPSVVRRFKCSTSVRADKWEDGILRFYYDFSSPIPDGLFKAD